ncbi:MAG: AAA family ATPase, partial [Terriglobia bacterium]
MRLARLDLTRYGHFADKRVELPKAASDLHLIVGENEAGKSTIRQAILD